MAYGTSAGHIKVISLSGYEQERFNFGEKAPIEFVQFVPGKLMLVSIDSENRLVVRYFGREDQMPGPFRKLQKDGSSEQIESASHQSSSNRIPK